VNAKTDSLGSATFAEALVGTALADTASEPAANTTYQGLQIKVSAEGVDPTGTDDVKTFDIGDISVKKGESIAAATVSAINGKIGETGVYAELGKDGAITLTSVKAGQQFATAISTDIDDTTAPEGYEATAATAALLGLDGTGGTIADDTVGSTLKDLSITTAAGAQQALDIVDKALESINSSRADLGAIQNRFTSVVANLQTSTENLSASRSRIRDTDFAKETAELTRTQILQQAGTAMLAQANQVPQNVLSLLR